MILRNALPLFLECMRRWEKRPKPAQFEAEYAIPMREVVGDFFDDFYSALTDVDREFGWARYREHALGLDAEREQRRLELQLQGVEGLLETKLSGELFLLGTFATMDGYARFDRGTHRVFVGVDESYANGRYVDILMAHELTHAARESQPTVWEGFGLSVNMTQDEFTDSQPVIEHLAGEGFSCFVSETLNPGQPAHFYAYQDEKSFELIRQNAAAIDEVVHKTIRNPDLPYYSLYDLRRYRGPLPSYSHYVWAWQWIKSLCAKQYAGSPRAMLSVSSQEWVDSALEFRLSHAL